MLATASPRRDRTGAPMSVTPTTSWLSATRWPALGDGVERGGDLLLVRPVARHRETVLEHRRAPSRALEGHDDPPRGRVVRRAPVAEPQGEADVRRAGRRRDHDRLAPVDDDEMRRLAGPLAEALHRRHRDLDELARARRAHAEIEQPVATG